MTAPASIYPRTVSELLPLARQWAEELGTAPSRNGLMRRFQIGRDKAYALLTALDSTTPDERITTPQAPATVTDPAPGPKIAPAPHVATVEPLTAVDVAPGPEIAPAPIAVTPPPLVAVDGHPDVRPAAVAVSAPVVAVRAVRRIRSWPVFIIGLGAFVGIWAGWVELGKLTGFGVVHPLPGIADDFSLNTAITLPLGMEAYAAYALKAWMTSGIPARARAFAKWSTIIALLVGMGGQVAYHLMVADGITAAPWQITTAVACLPVVVLGLAATLAHLLSADHDDEQA